MKAVQYFAIIIAAVISHGCVSEKSSNETSEQKSEMVSKKYENLNISILFDLSDRIDTTKYHNESMEYYLRDVAYVNSVVNAFSNHLKNKPIRTINDNIKVFFDPEPKNKNINEAAQNLNLRFNRNTVTQESIQQLETEYGTLTREIYEMALSDKHYIGSDTWGFFRSKVNDLCIEKDYRNILVILTDGYIYHTDSKRKEGNKTTYLTQQDVRRFGLNSENWQQKYSTDNYGFIPATSNLEELEVLVLGLNPDKKNPYEEDVLRSYWSDWFIAMGVKEENFVIKKSDLPSNLDKLIVDFIYNQH